jgi:S-(hydroxymethyl)glutathione dehydrogenase/alcohol dehydrogenase
MGTAVHCVSETRLGEGESAVVLGLGPVGLAVVQAAKHAGAGTIVAIDSVPERLELARSFGALPVHLTEEDPRAAVKAATEGRGADVAFEVVGNPEALDSAIRHVRRAGRVGVVGVHGQRCEVHMGLLWNKALTITTGLANVHRSMDIALAAIASGELDPSPLISDRLPLDRAPEAYDAYDRHEAMKIVLTT